MKYKTNIIKMAWLRLSLAEAETENPHSGTDGEDDNVGLLLAHN